MEKTILSLLNNQMNISPYQNAILSRNRSPLTYQLLIQQINKIAKKLNQYSVCRGDVVAIVLHTSGTTSSPKAVPLT